jgi:hypothetical protein
MGDFSRNSVRLSKWLFAQPPKKRGNFTQECAAIIRSMEWIQDLALIVNWNKWMAEMRSRLDIVSKNQTRWARHIDEGGVRQVR